MWVLLLLAFGAWAGAKADTAGSQQRASVASQRESIRQQAESLSLRLMPWPHSPVESAPECDPIADDIVVPLIEGAAKAQKVDAKLVRAVIERESGFRPCAVSRKGAQGLMQLMPETAGELAVRDVFDPQQNIQAGTLYLKRLLEKYTGDLGRALAAFNAGPAAVDQVKGIPDNPETRDYVDAILEKLGIKRTGPPQTQMPTPTEN
jgi:soluble lytic murein transglycosylase-like protein